MKYSPVYILIRTSKRPLFFKNMMQSIKTQTYPNIITVVHTDDPRDQYVEGDIILKSTRNVTKGRGHYNLYCNKLLAEIPVNKYGEGWYHLIDDDDMYFDDTVIEQAVENSKRTHVNIMRVKRWGSVVWPKNWGSQLSFQTECIFMHTDHRFCGTWWSKLGGDHNYTRQLTDKLPLNWIDGIIICKAQKGKGRGQRADLNEYDDWREKFDQRRKTTISVVGNRLQNIEWVEVIYKRKTTGRSSHRGNPSEVKIIPFDRHTQRLQNLGKIEVLRRLTKKQVEKIHEEIKKNY